MSRFNKRAVVGVRTAQGPIRTVPTNVPARTFEGGVGASRDAKSELFLLATTSLDITAKAFYESGDARVARFKSLVRAVAVEDPDWTYDFLKWLRSDGNIRTASIVGGVEASLAMVHDGITGSRAIIDAVCQRADEPGELTAYYLSTYGKKIPKPIKRGLADATVRLYSERSLLKYDTASHGVRFGDVIELVHPNPFAGPVVPDEASPPVEADEMAAWIDMRLDQAASHGRRKADLFKYAIDRRHGHDEGIPVRLKMLIANDALRTDVADGNYPPLLSPSTLHMAGMTWEDALSLAGSNVDKAALWKALIPSMGYMALLRNLRNFDEAGLTDEDVAPVIAKLTDPAEVAGSRQLPLRFLSAYRAVSNLRWAYPLEKALDLSLSNVPQMKGRTLILIDTSQSMDNKMSDRSGLLRWDAAVVFGLALARRCEVADVYSYSWSPDAARNYGYTSHPFPAGMSGDDPTLRFPLRAGESLLTAVARWKADGFMIAGGTDTVGALQKTVRPTVDRVVLLTDEQYGPFNRGVSPGSVVPEKMPMITCNLAGYAVAQSESSPYRVTLGGLTDQMFRLIPQVEAGISGAWPWESPRS